jgi:hypothetical protein
MNRSRAGLFHARYNGSMANGKDLSGLYLLLGALLGFFIALALVLVFVRPLIAAHYGPVSKTSKPPLAQTYAQTKVMIASTCTGAAIGMFAGVKVYSIRQRRREAARK